MDLWVSNTFFGGDWYHSWIDMKFFLLQTQIMSEHLKDDTIKIDACAIKKLSKKWETIRDSEVDQLLNFFESMLSARVSNESYRGIMTVFNAFRSNAPQNVIQEALVSLWTNGNHFILDFLLKFFILNDFPGIFVGWCTKFELLDCIMNQTQNSTNDRFKIIFYNVIHLNLSIKKILINQSMCVCAHYPSKQTSPKLH